VLILKIYFLKIKKYIILIHFQIKKIKNNIYYYLKYLLIIKNNNEQIFIPSPVKKQILVNTTLKPGEFLMNQKKSSYKELRITNKG